MERVIVKFTRGWGRYNRGDVAGFVAGTAAKLLSGDAKHGPVAVPFDAEAEEAVARVVDADVLAARVAEMDAREAELAKREAALGMSDPDVPEAGAPPAQGKKTGTK